MTKKRIPTVLLAVLLLGGGAGCEQGVSEDTAVAEQPDTTEFCEEHQIARAMCSFCDSSLVESLGFCHGHGVPEAFCYQCNPDLIPAFQAVGDWCAGHDRPESQCYICNPELDPFRPETPVVEASVGSGRSDGSGVTDAVRGEDLPRTMRAPSVRCSKAGLVVRFDSPDIAAQAGLEYATVETRPLTETVRCNAEVTYDGNRTARVVAQAPGVVAEIHRDLGDSVAAGEALVTITSPRLGAAKASYLRAVAIAALWRRNHEREAELLARGASTEKDLREAATRLAESRFSLSAAEQELLSYGFSGPQIEKILRTEDTDARYIVRAPLPGIVVDRRVVTGEGADPTKTLFTLADVSRMWANLDFHVADLRAIRTGQPVVLQADGLPGETFAGRITWVGNQVDPRTRTLRARAEFDNRNGLLRDHMFARASVAVRDRRPSLVVPAEAVQWEGCCNVVFIRESDTVFVPRQVHLGISTGTVHEVLAGVADGEEVVTSGSFLLKTEILKGSIGAGCCEVDPGT